MMKIDNLDEFVAGLLGRAVAVQGPLVRVIDDGADAVRETAVDGIAKPPKSGRIYTHRFPDVFPGGQRRAENKRGRPHQASAKDEYPAADTGNLMRSIHTLGGKVAASGETYQNGVAAAAEYARPLEYKPPERGGRPFLRRALAENRDDIRESAEAAIREGLRE